MQIGFDNEKYLAEQTAAILKRMERFEDKLYLEFGGKLLYDYHAARVLPGFDPNVKMRLLQRMKDQAEIILCIHAGDIERRKVRADFGITYDVDALKLIDDVRAWDLQVTAVIITRYDEQPAAIIFKNRLERHDIPVFTHRSTKGYPTDVDVIVSDQGYGANHYIHTERPLVVVTGPGPGSGKLATCMSQLYHDHLAGTSSGYAKFETFPIWNIPVKHPVNVAYEAATADLADFNLVDPFHLDAYGVTATNYNRDVEIFPVLKHILKRITGESIYKSPTDMGVNRAGFGIVDDKIVQAAANQEVIRRYFRTTCEHFMGLIGRETVERVHMSMEQLGVSIEDRRVVTFARQAATEARRDGKGNEGIFCGAAIELHDGTIVQGKNSTLMHAASSLILNAMKTLANIPDSIHLLSPNVIEQVKKLKENVLQGKTVNLDLEETLIALSISAATNDTARLAMERLTELRDCEVHMTHMPPPGDEAGLRKLGVQLTTEANLVSNCLHEY